jgi:hypothetical protein
VVSLNDKGKLDQMGILIVGSLHDYCCHSRDILCQGALNGTLACVFVHAQARRRVQGSNWDHQRPNAAATKERVPVGW